MLFLEAPKGLSPEGLSGAHTVKDSCKLVQLPCTRLLSPVP